MDKARLQEYWRRNVGIMRNLLIIWFLGSYGAGILFAPGLGKLGFWFAQQGSIYVFVVLIWVYVAQMNKLDREFDVAED